MGQPAPCLRFAVFGWFDAWVQMSFQSLKHLWLKWQLFNTCFLLDFQSFDIGLNWETFKRGHFGLMIKWVTQMWWHQLWLIWHKLSVSSSSAQMRRSRMQQNNVVKTHGEQWGGYSSDPSNQSSSHPSNSPIQGSGLFLSPSGLCCLALQHMTGSQTQQERSHSSRWSVCLFTPHSISELIVIFTGTVSQQKHQESVWGPDPGLTLTKKTCDETSIQVDFLKNMVRENIVRHTNIVWCESFIL